jgi:hypothetical protein
LAKNDLAATEAARTQERWVEAFKTNKIAFEFTALIASVHKRNFDRNELFALTRRKDCEMPSIARIGWIELHDEWSVVARHDWGRPTFECVGEFASKTCGNVEWVSIESREERFGRCCDGLGIIGSGRNLDASRSVVTDDVDNFAENRAGHGAAVDRGRKCSDSARHGIANDAKAIGIDKRWLPRNAESTAVLIATACA